MRMIWLWIFLNMAAALVPFMHMDVDGSHGPDGFDGWPAEFNGLPLESLGLTDEERGFTEGFPGRIERFTDGSQEIIIRWVAHGTRKLHPASDCLKGSGYSMTHLPVRMDTEGNHWGCVRAVRGSRTLEVCERVYDGQGASWSDVSSWYWNTVLRSTEGPWWAVTVAKEVR